MPCGNDYLVDAMKSWMGPPDFLAQDAQGYSRGGIDIPTKPHWKTTPHSKWQILDAFVLARAEGRLPDIAAQHNQVIVGLLP
jgi:hypothetical protein